MVENLFPSTSQPDQQPPLGIDPQNIFNLLAIEPVKQTTDHPKKNHGNNNNVVYCAVYSGVPVYEMMCRNVAVMRRQRDSFLNATQVLKVAQIDKGKRTKILEKEIHNREHEKVQGGYGKYQGTWIPFERGVELARLYNVDDLLNPLLEYTPPQGNGEKTPTKEQIRGSQKPVNMRRNSLLSTSSTNNHHNNNNHHHDKKMYKESHNSVVEMNEFNGEMVNADEFNGVVGCDASLSAQNFEFGDGKYAAYGNYYQSDPFMYYCPQMSPPPPVEANPAPVAVEPSAERHRACIMSWFYNSNNKNSYEMLYPHTMFPFDFEIDLVLDTQGHTALHWAAALGNIGLLNLLIQKGAKVDHLNNSGESALIRSVMVSYNHEQQTFPELIISLKDVMFIPDRKNRTLLHHICLSFNPKAKTQSCVYYMQCLLEYLANAQYDEQVSSQMIHSEILFVDNALQNWINSQDVCGDTAINIAARLGSKQLYDMLLLAGANADIANGSGLKPNDFGIDVGNDTSNNNEIYASKGGPTVVYPGIQTDQESSSQATIASPQVYEKSDSEYIAELKAQLVAMSREINSFRQDSQPLISANAEITSLKQRIKELEMALTDSARYGKPRNSSTSSVESMLQSENLKNQDMISRLRQALIQQKAVESRLVKELLSLRQGASDYELICKKIVACCCDCNESVVDQIMGPLFNALETQGRIDMRMLTGFLEPYKRGREEHCEDTLNEGGIENAF